MNAFRLGLQLAIGIVFLLSTLPKLLDPLGFARGLRQFELLHASMVLPAAILIIVLECFLTVSHLSGWQLASALPVGVAALLVFTGVIAVTLRRGRSLPCHCFGVSSRELISARTLLRTLLILGGECAVLMLASVATTAAAHPAMSSEYWTDVQAACFWATCFLVASWWCVNSEDIAQLAVTQPSGEQNVR